jgi:hypothetical protein
VPAIYYKNVCIFHEYKISYFFIKQKFYELFKSLCEFTALKMTCEKAYFLIGILFLMFLIPLPSLPSLSHKRFAPLLEKIAGDAT